MTTISSQHSSTPHGHARCGYSATPCTSLDETQASPEIHRAITSDDVIPADLVLALVQRGDPRNARRVNVLTRLAGDDATAPSQCISRRRMPEAHIVPATLTVTAARRSRVRDPHDTVCIIEALLAAAAAIPHALDMAMQRHRQLNTHTAGEPRIQDAISTYRQASDALAEAVLAALLTEDTK